MAANQISVHPAFYARVRHYRNRIRKEGRPQVAKRFVNSVHDLVGHLFQNPHRGHSAGFEAADLSEILRASVPAFNVFALFYRWDGKTLTIITLEHTAQDLPSRIATILSNQL